MSSLEERTTEVVIEGLTKKYGDITAVNDIDLVAEEGELTTLVGPSGCGKTTTLRCIAGLEFPNAGTIRIGDRVVNDAEAGLAVAPQQRDIGFIFQTFNVWPHLSVYDNVALPLQVRDFTSAEVEEKVMDVLELTDIAELRDKNATDLSGGQQTRVGICRAIVTEPKVLLADEPLTGLDRNLRTRMRYEIQQLQSEIGITTIYVTHSQPEAMTLSDKICLMNRNGTIEQKGTASEIYNQPVSRYSFEFFGSSEFIEGTQAGDHQVDTHVGPLRYSGDVLRIEGEAEAGNPVSDSVVVGLRPEEIEIGRTRNPDWTDNTLSGRIQTYSFFGETHEFGVQVNGELIRSRLSRLSEPLEEGDEVFLHVNPEDVYVFEEV